MVDWQVVQELGPYSWNGIGTALLCGAIVGLERQIRGKPVGIRTAALIILGTYLFLVGGSSAVGESGDPSRVIGQIITGIGFLGAGVMLARDGVVVGVTSAATIWALAAIGIAVGLGMYGVGIVLSLVIVGVLLGVDLLEDTFQSLTRGVHRKYSGWRRSRGDSNEP
ncbi:MgtC/SapB family protein [Idiomarina loihiensis]|uniref:MgtC/SapB family protein n=1 Tax=Idiomarina loihiensis TaxID=135577 RepID=UPI00130929F5|nr:MgtC/SapB family protein [Idiomarina loihiensis]MRJ45714.1 MgtC/SapB family protein [Idiomarina loihiensis]UTW32845.1 MgtC/SapB family protein [Idiomarina loihiensis]